MAIDVMGDLQDKVSYGYSGTEEYKLLLNLTETIANARSLQKAANLFGVEKTELEELAVRSKLFNYESENWKLKYDLEKTKELVLLVSMKRAIRQKYDIDSNGMQTEGIITSRIPEDDLLALFDMSHEQFQKYSDLFNSELVHLGRSAPQKMIYCPAPLSEFVKTAAALLQA